jgi:hypothetical protein
MWAMGLVWPLIIIVLVFAATVFISISSGRS